MGPARDRQATETERKRTSFLGFTKKFDNRSVGRNMQHPLTLLNFFFYLRNTKLGKGLVFFLVFCFLNPSVSLGLPQGGQVESGSASFENLDANTLNIVTSDQVIINWQSFDITMHETVNFIQPAITSIALNRVMAGGSTSIAGALNANGGIIIVNPAGINFASTADVRVASLIASSLNIRSSDFLASQYYFARNGEEPMGMVRNQGKILAAEDGFLLMLGGAVENSGTLTAKMGTVAMASGDAATVSVAPNGLVSVAVDKATQEKILNTDGTAVTNAVANTASGVVDASGGKVQLTAETLAQVFDRAINQEGLVIADSVRQREGRVELVSSSGVVRNAGVMHADGTFENPIAGAVLLSGEKTIQAGLVSANAFDTGKAGKVEIYSEKGTWLLGGSKTEAKADGFRGEGGTVLINAWDGNTDLNRGGAIDVSGGTMEGGAGFIELSAHDTVTWNGTMRGVAQDGYAGARLLIDPLNIVLNTSTQTAPTNNANGTADVGVEDAPLAGTTTIEIADVTGFSELFLQAIQDITLSNTLTMGSGKNII